MKILATISLNNTMIYLKFKSLSPSSAQCGFRHLLRVATAERASASDSSARFVRSIHSSAIVQLLPHYISKNGLLN